MNSRERVIAAIEHRTPDRLPITFEAEKEVIAVLKKHFGVTSRDAVWDALNVDTRLVGVDHHDPRIRDEGEISYDFWGIGSKLQAYPGGTYSEYCVFPLAGMETVADIEAYHWPTVDEMSFESLRAARAANPDKAIIAHITHAPYFKATHLRGMENFMMDLALNPPLAEAIIRKVSDYLFPALERLCREAGDTFDIFYIADDFCTALGPLISPDMFRQYIQPYLTHMSGIVHQHGKKFLLHTCGAVRPLLKDIIAAGVDVLEPIQTSAAGMEVEGLKRDFGDHLAFYGSIDLIKVLSQGSPAEVRQEVLRNFGVLGKNGGFIVGPGHTYIQPDVPLENILAMYETAYRECRYGQES
jgi:uroporphyrinogen decarboxylase